MERKIIIEYEQAGRISSRYAKQLRKEVNTLENYTLKETSNTLIYDMINLARRELKKEFRVEKEAKLLIFLFNVFFHYRGQERDSPILGLLGYRKQSEFR